MGGAGYISPAALAHSGFLCYFVVGGAGGGGEAGVVTPARSQGYQVGELRRRRCWPPDPCGAAAARDGIRAFPQHPDQPRQRMVLMRLPLDYTMSAAPAIGRAGTGRP